MSERVVIAGMWGTSNLNLFLLKEHSKCLSPSVIEKREGPGASQISSDAFESTLFHSAEDWLQQYPQAPFVLSGMVGSTIGWKDVGYVACPYEIVQRGGYEYFEASGHDVYIAKGAQCQNLFGAPDVMRGEETELVGLVAREPSYQVGRHLICIPGTHAKWVLIDDGKVLNFTTSLAGEMFDVLLRNRVLLPKTLAKPREMDDSFYQGLKEISDDPGAFMHRIFSVRARQIVDGLKPEEGIQLLSGLIIGADVSAALKVYESHGLSNRIAVIGATRIAARYAKALEFHGRETETYNSSEMSAYGLWSLYDSICQAGVR